MHADSVEPMRLSNPEWDFMHRSFYVLSMANLALRRPQERQTYLERMDRVIDETLEIERSNGHHYYLLPYSTRAEFRFEADRSLFVDGELLVMVAARQLVEHRDDLQPDLERLTVRVVEQLSGGPVLSGESYPDECWSFCNTFALAGLELARAAGGADHRQLARRWVDVAKERLLDPESGLIVSSYTWDGRHLDGPEGSTLWITLHNLLLVDEQFARDQYEIAKAELGHDLLGFAWAAEWPSSWQGPADVDSGPIVPVVDASAGSSGTAFVAARAFHDEEFLEGLLTTLDFAAFPSRDEVGLHYAASSPVGDAVVLYGLTQGPLWERAGGAS